MGSPGGPTIINTVLEVIVNVLDFGMNVQDAVNWPRFHHQWMPDELRLEQYVVLCTSPWHQATYWTKPRLFDCPQVEAGHYAERHKL